MDDHEMTEAASVVVEVDEIMQRSRGTSRVAPSVVTVAQ
jgi:hypothetical protein